MYIYIYIYIYIIYILGHICRSWASQCNRMTA